MADDENVKVFCRVRPPNEREGGAAAAFVKKCVAVPTSDPLQQTVTVQLRGMGPQAVPKTFTFDRVFSELSSQNDVFEVVGVPITQACLQGYNGTIFAYGQTGSGKTFTMQGPDDVIDTEARRLSETELSLRGVVPRVFDYLFKNSSSRGALRVPVTGDGSATTEGTTRVEHTFACSFMEIYNERVYDLLDLNSTRDAAGLTLRENGRKGVFVEGLIESVVTNAKQAAELMAIGARNRRVGQTAMNRESSRSHSVFVLQIQSKETTADGITRTRLSRFNLVDLAGSERQKNTEAAGERLKEAGSINKSLSALGNVIMGLVEQSAGKNRHVHYRDSKLTFLLKDSLGGNSKTFMIATVSPAEDSSHETLSTLKFAQRAKLIRNNAVINEDTTGSVVVLQEEILRLRRQLQEALGSSGSSLTAKARLASSATDALPEAVADDASPGVSERIVELESALAYSLEKNDELQRSQGRLVVQAGHLQRLCSELKKTSSHLRLRLRLKNTDGDVEMEDQEPSSDAIEWRMKYEELEESLVELQERMRDQRVPDAGDQSVEFRNLHAMYFTLTKQLATLIREKHDLATRLANDPNENDDDTLDKLSQLELELRNTSVEYQAQLNSVLQMCAAAEEKAQSASLELLSSKQKEASWKVENQHTELKMDDLREQLADALGDAARWKHASLDEKRHRLEFETVLQNEWAAAKQSLDTTLANNLTESFELRQRLQAIESDLVQARATAESASLSLASSQAVVATKNIEIKTLEESAVGMKGELERQVEQISQLEESNAALTRTLKETAARLEEKEVDTEQLGKRLDVATLELTKSQGEIEDLQATVSNLQRENADLLAEHKKHVNEFIRKHQEEQEAAKITFAESTRQYEVRLSETLYELQETHTRSQQAAHAHEEESTKLRSEIESLAKRMETEQTEHARTVQLAEQQLLEASARHEEEVERLMADAADEKSTSEAAMENLKKLREDRDQTICELKTTVEKLMEERDATSLTLKSLQQSVAELSSQLEERERDLTEKNEALDRGQKELEEAHEEANEHRVRLSGQIQLLEASLADLRRTHDVLLSSHQSLTSEHTQVARVKQKKLDDLTTDQRKTIAKLTEESTQAAARISNMESRVRELESNLEKQSAERSRLVDEKQRADVAIAELRQLVSRREEEIDEKDSVISGMEETVETLEVDKAQALDELQQLTKRLESAVADVEAKTATLERVQKDYDAAITKHKAMEAKLQDELGSNALDMAAARNMITSQQLQIDESENEISLLTKQVAELSTNSQALKEQLGSSERNLADVKTKHEKSEESWSFERSRFEAELLTATEEFKTANKAMSALEAAAASDLAVWKEKNVKLEEETTSLHRTIHELQKNAKASDKDSQSTQKALLHDLEELRAELKHTSEKATRLRRKSETLQEVNDQLTFEIKEGSARITKYEERTSKLESELRTVHERYQASEAALDQAKSNLAAMKSELKELAIMHEQLLTEVAAVKTDFDAKLRLWELKDKELQGRSSVVETMETQVADESKKLAEEKVALAQKRKEVEKILKEYREQKTRLQELETLKIQLQKEKEKYRREANILTVKLEEALKAKDELVGHHNKRQKIQHHIKVKEENNRLIEELKQLTEDKFRLEVRVKKLEHSLKEKENLVSDALLSAFDDSKSQASVQSTTSMKLQSAALPSMAKPVTESSQGGAQSPSQKRMRSRIE